MAARNSAVLADEREPQLEIERLFDAPCELVFDAWADPERAARWWGPQGFTTLSLDMDVRAGGAYRHSMRTPQGTVHVKRGVFREVRRPERLVFTFAWEAADGSVGPETVVTVRFIAEGSKTRLVLHQAVFESATARDMHHRGWSSTLERLAGFVATRP